MQNATRSEGPSAPAPLTVSQLAALIDRAVREHTPTGLKVVGEIGQFRERAHWYFDLKDSGAVISCVMWNSAARKLGFAPRTGQQVLATGRAEFYPPQGRTQFMVDKLEPVGAGALDLALRQLVEEARALGWLDESRKRPLPLYPRKVAVITSATGAALQDVLDTLRRRCPSLQVALVDVRVQGETAASEVARAVRVLSDDHELLAIDVVLITRGGGSMEDLWAFNDRVLAEAIVASRVPVVAAIGHETDTTLAELVADVRAATPTQAAMRIAPDADDLRRQLHSLGQRARSVIQRHVRAEYERLRSAERHARLALRDSLRSSEQRIARANIRLERARPAAIYAQREARLASAADRLARAARSRLDGEDLDTAARRLAASVGRSLLDLRTAVEAAARNLDLVGPPSVIKRGYSVTLGPDGALLRSVTGAAPGQSITTRLADGSLHSTVSAHADQPAIDHPVTPAGRSPIVRSSRRAPSRETPPDQPSLFG